MKYCSIRCMLFIILSPILACGDSQQGRGTLLRIAVNNTSPHSFDLRIRTYSDSWTEESTFQFNNDSMRSNYIYTIPANKMTSVAHGWICRQYGEDRARWRVEFFTPLTCFEAFQVGPACDGGDTTLTCSATECSINGNVNGEPAKIVDCP